MLIREYTLKVKERNKPPSPVRASPAKVLLQSVGMCSLFTLPWGHFRRTCCPSLCTAKSYRRTFAWDLNSYQETDRQKSFSRQQAFFFSNKFIHLFRVPVAVSPPSSPHSPFPQTPLCHASPTPTHSPSTCVQERAGLPMSINKA